MDKRRWPYNPERSSRGKFKEQITPKQVDYILGLRNKKPNGKYLNEILHTIPEWQGAGPINYTNLLRTLTKGQASFVISALRGDIQPTNEINEQERKAVLDEARRIMLGDKPNLTGRNFPKPIDDE